MKSLSLHVMLVVLAISIAGCRQADGTLPAPQGDVPNRLGDLGRDLIAVASGETAAKQDFVEDLRVFARNPDGETAAAAFAVRVGDAIAGTTLNEQSAQQLAHTSWTIVSASELSERQVEMLRNDVKAQLMALGIPEDRSEAVAGLVPEVQKTITTRPRRWYEVF